MNEYRPMNRKPIREQIEKKVRKKNSVYLKWRRQFTAPALDSICTEMLMRFSELPYGKHYRLARRNASWAEAEKYAREQAAWKNAIRAWAMERGIVTYPRQSAQLVKYYFAWLRVTKEKVNE